MRLRILGESVIEVDGRNVTPSATHLFALLLYLGIERGRAVSRAELASLLFPGGEFSSAAHSLRQLLYRVRQMGVETKATGSSILVARDLVGGIALDVLSGDGPQQLLGGPGNCELLPHYTPPTAPMSRWLETLRDRLYRQFLRRFGEQMHAARQRADWRAVEALANASLALDPFNETATLLLAEGLARTGSKQQAVSLLHQFEKDLGRSAGSLALPPRLLKRRISEAPLSMHVPEAPLIGRAAEMTRLAHVWARARQGSFGAVAVAGEKSIGKSRVVAEFLAMVRVDGSGAIINTRRTPADLHRPMSLFADICKQLTCLPGAAGCAPANVPFLKRLTEAPDGANSPRSEENAADFTANSVRHSVIDLFESVCAERPLICYVDDADNLDESSLDILADIQRRLVHSPLLILLAGECVEKLRTFTTTRLTLRPLTTSDSHTLAVALNTRSGADLADEALSRCVAFSGGNPGYLEVLVGHAARSHGVTDIPSDLIDLTDDRIAGLTIAALHTLQACVVFGGACNSDALCSLTGLDQYSLLASLHELEDRSLILSSRSGVTPRSALVEQRTRNSISGSVCSTLHRRAARYLEGQHQHAVPSQAVAWQIASHWDEAGDTASAIRWRRICWRQLISIGKPMAAVESIRAHLARACIPAERASILDALIESLHSAADPQALAAAISERIALSDHVEDSRKTRSALALDLAEAAINNYEDRAPFLSQLRLHLHSPSLDVTRRVRALRLLLIAADDAADPQSAHDVYVVSEKLRPLDEDSTLTHLHSRLIYHAIFGCRRKAIRIADSIAEIAHSGERSWRVLTSELNTSMARHIVDALPRSYEPLEHRFEECRSAGMDAVALRFSARLTVIHFDNGHPQDAAIWGAISAKLARSLPPQRLSLDFLTGQIDLALYAGDFARAESLVELMRANAPAGGHSRSSQLWLFCGMRLAQCRGRDVDDGQLAALQNWHWRASTYGRHDDEMEILWVALNRRHEAERASQLLEEYLLTSRRELRSPNYFLRLRTSSDVAWAAFDKSRQVPDKREETLN